MLPISPWKFSFFSGHDSYSLAWALELVVSTGSDGWVFSERLRLWTVSPSPTSCSAAPGGELPVTSYSGQEGLQPARMALTVGVHEDQHVPGGPGGAQHPGPGGAQPPVAPEQLHPLQPGHILAESRLELSWKQQDSGVTDATAREIAMTLARNIVNRSILGAVVSTSPEQHVHGGGCEGVKCFVSFGGSGFSPLNTKRNGVVKLREERTRSHSLNAAMRLKQILLVPYSEALRPLLLIWFALHVPSCCGLAANGNQQPSLEMCPRVWEPPVLQVAGSHAE